MNSFAAIADDTRREIVTLLAKKVELSATDISNQFEMSPPAVSQHLKVLREAKVLSMKKQGQQRLYSINQEGISEIEDWLIGVKKIWEKRLDKLDSYLMKLKKKSKERKKSYGNKN